MAYNLLGTRYTYYVDSGTSTPSYQDIRGYGKAYYDQTSTDIANNQSRIKLEYGVVIVNDWLGQYSITGTIYQKINGTWTSVSTSTYNSGATSFIAGTYLNGTLSDVIIPHDNTGNAQVRVGVTVTGISGVRGTKSYAYIYDLPTITEQAYITDVTTVEANATLVGYGIGDNTYVNLLSNKGYNISVYNPNSLTIDSYEVINGTPTYKFHYSSGVSNTLYLNFNDWQIYTDIINGEERPSMLAKVNFQNGSSVYTYINYTGNNFISYSYPLFSPTTCTTKRNGQLSGKVTLNAQGTYYNGSIGTLNQGGNYKPIVKYKLWKKEDTEPSTYAYTIPAENITVNDGTFSITNYEIGSDNTSAANYFDYNYSYYVKLQVSDTFKASDTTTDVTQGVAIWTEYADRVDFKKITTKEIIAGNIDSGINTIGYASTGTQVNFNKTFSTAPNVVLTPVTTVSGTVTPKIKEITTTHFVAFMSGSSNIDCCWIAIGN